MIHYVLNIQYMYLSSIAEKETSSAIRVLSISWSETLLSYQCSLLVSQTLEWGERQQQVTSGYRHLLQHSFMTEQYVYTHGHPWPSVVCFRHILAMRNKATSKNDTLCCYVCVL